MTMLGRVRRRQEDTDPSLITKRPAKNSHTDDFFRALMVQAQRYRLESADFDITQGTILDSQLRPEQFDEITEAILTKLTQLPSIIKAHFSWTWQCATLNRSDEVVSMTLASIHPYNLPLPNYTYQDGRISATGREVFGVLAMFHETKTAQPGKTEPVYSFALPHRDPLMCSVSALAILLHFMFDQKDLISRVPSWNWIDSTTWQTHHVVFGKNVNEPMGGDGLGRMYSSFLDFTTVNSTKKTHLARRTMPSKLEEMGVPADQVDATGHWQGNTRRKVYSSKIPKAAAVALAGFPVGESYYVPWSQVPVPDSLQLKLYPFCEDALALLRANGCKNQGMINFLILLQNLRPFFWRAISAINHRFPKSPLVQRLKILEDSDAEQFLRDWPTLCKQEEHTRHQSLLIEQAFQERPTQNAFAAVVSEIRSLRHTVESSSSQISVIHRRSAILSPSKHSQSDRSQAPFPKHRQLSNPASENHHSVIVGQGAQEVTLPDSEPLDCLEPTITTPYQCRDPQQLSVSLTGTSNTPIHQTPSKFCEIPGQQLHDIRLVISRVGTNNVLHLTPPTSPEQPPPHTQHDLILPPCTAFNQSHYPQFTTHNCTWQHILDAVSNPVELWAAYEPGSLGEYRDIKSLWQAWDEGTFVPNVGHKPALRLIDSRWGDLKNQKTNKKKFPAWRPRNNDNARTKWSRFYFFIKLIQARVDEGSSTDSAVQYFDSLRKDDSVHALFKSLKPKNISKPS
ncbi:hypothetical protein CVT24_001164 [Panaeolus cyanescens]|uniref:Ndc10 domain-containing protein n=1 Tax=Panaeolus cyanescens TaxID=181874 RepID=A0A409WXK4_9AGAR|nr:hypothetical protein CVT24_001164 [Panaeolus cyanescens]